MTLQGTLQQWQLVSHANEAQVRHFLALSLSFVLLVTIGADFGTGWGFAGIGKVR